MYRAERLPGSVGRWLTLESMYCSATLLLIFGKYTFCGFTSIKKKQLFSMFRHWFFLICALHSVKQGSAPFSSGYQRTAGFLSSIQKYLSSWKKKKGWRSNLTYLINEMEWDWPDRVAVGMSPVEESPDAVRTMHRNRYPSKHTAHTCQGRPTQTDNHEKKMEDMTDECCQLPTHKNQPLFLTLVWQGDC